jgi:hypothetical protein
MNSLVKGSIVAPAPKNHRQRSVPLLVAVAQAIAAHLAAFLGVGGQLAMADADGPKGTLRLVMSSGPGSARAPQDSQ